jgi:hypothetical protein
MATAESARLPYDALCRHPAPRDAIGTHKDKCPAGRIPGKRLAAPRRVAASRPFFSASGPPLLRSFVDHVL